MQLLMTEEKLKGSLWSLGLDKWVHYSHLMVVFETGEFRFHCFNLTNPTVSFHLSSPLLQCFFVFFPFICSSFFKRLSFNMCQSAPFYRQLRHKSCHSQGLLIFCSFSPPLFQEEEKGARWALWFLKALVQDLKFSRGSINTPQSLLLG